MSLAPKLHVVPSATPQPAQLVGQGQRRSLLVSALRTQPHRGLGNPLIFTNPAAAWVLLDPTGIGDPEKNGG